MFRQVDEGRNAAVQLMQQAIEQLIANGLTAQAAEARVKANFQHLNLEAKEPITLESLCQLP